MPVGVVKMFFIKYLRLIPTIIMQKCYNVKGKYYNIRQHVTGGLGCATAEDIR